MHLLLTSVFQCVQVKVMIEWLYLTTCDYQLGLKLLECLRMRNFLSMLLLFSTIMCGLQLIGGLK